MFWFVSKKEWKKELKKVKHSFNRVRKKNNSHNRNINNLRDKTNSNEIKIARLEGALKVLLTKSQVSVSRSPKQSQANIETKVINKIKRSKKALITNEIMELSKTMSVIEMFNIIVLEKGLCSKATFYRYINYLKSQSLIKSETEIKTTDLKI